MHCAQQQLQLCRHVANTRLPAAICVYVCVRGCVRVVTADRIRWRDGHSVMCDFRGGAHCVSGYVNAPLDVMITFCPTFGARVRVCVGLQELFALVGCKSPVYCESCNFPLQQLPSRLCCLALSVGVVYLCPALRGDGAWALVCRVSLCVCPCGTVRETSMFNHTWAAFAVCLLAGQMN